MAKIIITIDADDILSFSTLFDAVAKANTLGKTRVAHMTDEAGSLILQALEVGLDADLEDLGVDEKTADEAFAAAQILWGTTA